MIPFAVMTPTQSSSDGNVEKPLELPPRPSWPGSCTKTGKYRAAWWKVTLDRDWDISSVKLTNRIGGDASRLQNVDIYIGGKKCADSVDVGDGETKEIACVGRGQEIKIAHKKKQSL